jgi:hypothetical protein
MSADNGLLIWRDGHGTFRLAEYCASVDYARESEMPSLGRFSTIEEAIRAAKKYARANVVEYGIDFAEGTV